MNPPPQYNQKEELEEEELASVESPSTQTEDHFHPTALALQSASVFFDPARLNRFISLQRRALSRVSVYSHLQSGVIRRAHTVFT